ncbi:SDR family oxidoreductase [Bacillus thuringiensis]|uniref:SDR family oxidoreductase n=1 Tax=Bacillus thuringiensis TaxID=1428 RepID=UPI00333D6092
MEVVQRKVAIVTGASRESGIGTAICLELAKRGIDIFFTYYSDFDIDVGYNDANDNWHINLQNKITKLGVRCSSMSANYLDPMIVNKILDETQRSLGLPSILINNAAYCKAVDYKQVTTEIFKEHLDVNVLSTCMLSVEFAKRFTGKLGGRIINLVSGQDKNPEVGNLPYSVSKGAMSTFTRTFALEVASLGITVNAVDPGPTDTGWMDEDFKSELLLKFPSSRIGLPKDAAKAIGFLISQEAERITGQIIHSDGGFRGR